MDPRPSQPGSPEAPAGKAVETDMTDAAWRAQAHRRRRIAAFKTQSNNPAPAIATATVIRGGDVNCSLTLGEQRPHSLSEIPPKASADWGGVHDPPRCDAPPLLNPALRAKRALPARLTLR